MTLFGSPRERLDDQDLLGSSYGTIDVMEHGAGQSVTASAERDSRVETDPTTVRLSKQVDCEVDIGKHPLFRRFADCYSICRIDQPHKSCEVRHRLIVDQIDVGGH